MVYPFTVEIGETHKPLVFAYCITAKAKGDDSANRNCLCKLRI